MTEPAAKPEISLLDGNFYASDPHPTFRWMRKHEPVYFDEPSGVWGITRYADVLSVSKDPKTFSNEGGIRPDAPPLPDMIHLDDPLHKQRRNIVNKGFTVRRVAEQEPKIRSICRSLIDRVVDRDEFDFVMDLAAWLPLIVIGDRLGVEPDAYDDLLRWSDEMVVASGATDVERMQTGWKAFDDYAAYQRRVIADRRAKPPQEDLISLLVHSEVDGFRLTDEEILMNALLILVGGDETTRHVISGGMYELFHRPDARRQLAEHPERIPIAVEEMLRWVSPIKNMARTATCDTEVRGTRIRAGDKLLLLYPSANRDEDIFPRSMAFDIARTPNEHIAFGFGPHYCLGASLARLELRVFFEELLPRLPGLELACDARPPERASNFISGIERMPVRNVR